MSFINAAAASLTTLADCTRRPAVDKAQVIRMLVFCLLIAVTLVVMHRQQGHAEGGRHPAITTPSSGAR